MKDNKYISVPPLDSIRELADFFDSNSTEDIEWESSDVRFKREGEKEEKEDLVHVSIRIPRRDLDELRYAANKAGVGHTTYIRMLIRRAINR